MLVADTCLCTYFILAELRRRGVDLVVPLPQCRRADFRTGKQLGHEDHLVVWTKPPCPDGMTAEEYAHYADTLSVRELRVRLRTKTSRRRTLVLVTTLLDAKRYPQSAMAELYRQRWHGEVDWRSLKDVMPMDILRGKTPAMVQKEMGAHFLAYNLIRTVMAQAAVAQGRDPRKLSFKGALQTMRAFALPLQLCPNQQLPDLVQRVLAAIARHKVGHRPNRVEPRANKRRPKSMKLLTVPREQARKLELAKRSG